MCTDCYKDKLKKNSNNSVLVKAKMISFVEYPKPTCINYNRYVMYKAIINT